MCSARSDDLFENPRKCQVLAGNLPELERELAAKLGVAEALYVMIFDEDFEEYCLPDSFDDFKAKVRVKVNKRQVAESVTVMKAAQPAPPAPPVMVDNKPTTMVLSWTAPRDNGGAITEYKLQKRVEGEDEWTTTSFVSTTSAEVPKSKSAETVCFRVLASNSAGWSDPSISSKIIVCEAAMVEFTLLVRSDLFANTRKIVVTAGTVDRLNTEVASKLKDLPSDLQFHLHTDSGVLLTSLAQLKPKDKIELRSKAFAAAEKAAAEQEASEKAVAVAAKAKAKAAEKRITEQEKSVADEAARARHQAQLVDAKLKAELAVREAQAAADKKMKQMEAQMQAKLESQSEALEAAADARLQEVEARAAVAAEQKTAELSHMKQMEAQMQAQMEVQSEALQAAADARLQEVEARAAVAAEQNTAELSKMEAQMAAQTESLQAAAKARLQEVEAQAAAAVEAAKRAGAELAEQRLRDQQSHENAPTAFFPTKLEAPFATDLWAPPGQITKQMSNQVQSIVQALVPNGDVENFWTTTVVSP